MGHFEKPIFILIIMLAFMGNTIHGQNYRDQKKLIRPKPNNLLVFGQVQNSAEETVTGATISLFDPAAAKILETIPIDDMGEYLFTLEMGKTFGFIIEKEGFFPYYTEFVVPSDLEKEWDKPINLPDGLVNRYELHYSYGATRTDDQEVLDDLIATLTNFRDLSVWVPGEADSIFNLRTANLRNSLLEAGVETYRLYSGNPPSDPDSFIQLIIISDSNSPENDTAEVDNIDENTISEEAPAAGKWTLQFIASKNELPASDLKDLDGYKLFRGKDGYYRYTYGVYDSKEEAASGKELLKSKGFSQSFAKKIEDLQKL